MVLVLGRGAPRPRIMTLLVWSVAVLSTHFWKLTPVELTPVEHKKLTPVALMSRPHDKKYSSLIQRQIPSRRNEREHKNIRISNPGER